MKSLSDCQKVSIDMINVKRETYESEQEIIIGIMVVPGWSKSEGFPLGVNQRLVIRLSIVQSESTKLRVVDVLNERSVRGRGDARNEHTSWSNRPVDIIKMSVGNVRSRRDIEKICCPIKVCKSSWIYALNQTIVLTCNRPWQCRFHVH
jgi:hypothetical protein